MTLSWIYDLLMAVIQTNKQVQWPQLSNSLRTCIC